jgi:Flp pilus assembly pilin Flp
MQWFALFLKDESGVATVVYALVAAAMGMALATAMPSLSQTITAYVTSGT